MTKKRHASIPLDADTYQAMTDYAALYGLTLSDLVARMWALWQQVEEMRGIQPTFPPLQEPLEPFLQAMEAEADSLDEEYINLDREDEATKARNEAIAAYQAENPFEPDSDSSPVECPHCHRQTTRAGLVHLPGNVVKCSYCYSLPKMLQDYEQRYGSE